MVVVLPVERRRIRTDACAVGGGTLAAAAGLMTTPRRKPGPGPRSGSGSGRVAAGIDEPTVTPGFEPDRRARSGSRRRPERSDDDAVADIGRRGATNRARSKALVRHGFAGPNQTMKIKALACGRFGEGDLRRASIVGRARALLHAVDRLTSNSSFLATLAGWPLWRPSSR